VTKHKDKQKIRTAKRREFSKPANDSNRGFRPAGSQNRKKSMSIKDRRGTR
jgi:hypothetical protein